jgi:hypothetical protein
MQERQLLAIDSLFTDHFFEKGNAALSFDELRGMLDFPLPDSAERLREFMQSVDGNLFRAGVTSMMERLLSFSGINRPAYEAKISAFLRENIHVTGQDVGLAQICMPLYQRGLPFMAGIERLLLCDEIPLSFRQDSLKSLLSNLDICAPGVYTHLSNLYLKLHSYLDVKTDFMMFREELSRHLIAEKIRKCIIPMALLTATKRRWVCSK